MTKAISMKISRNMNTFVMEKKLWRLLNSRVKRETYRKCWCLQQAEHNRGK